MVSVESSGNNKSSVKSMVELHENQITKANAITTSISNSSISSSASPISPLPTSDSTTPPYTITTSTALPKSLNDLKELDAGNDSESDLEDGLLTESLIFPNPNKIVVDTTTTPAASKKEEAATPITSSPLSTTTTTTLPSKIGDSPLAEILKSIGELSAKEQEIVKNNLERLGGYPAELPLSDSWTLYFSDTSRATKSSHSATQEQYTESQTPIFTVTSVPALCGSLKAYKRLVRSKRSRNNEPDTMGLGQFRAGMNLHCFRSYSKPTWEDPWNQKGGRLTISPPSHLLDSTFERLVLLLAGSSLETNVTESLIASPSPNRKSTGPVVEGLIIGVVASKRARGDRVELWLGGREENQPAPGEWVDRLKEVLSVELEMPELRTGKYKKHF